MTTSPAQYVTLVTTGGTPVRLADQTGAPYPTTGTGSLVFNVGAHLISPMLDYPIFVGPYTVTGPFTVDGDLLVTGAITEGVWEGTPIAIEHGGTGSTSAQSAEEALHGAYRVDTLAEFKALTSRPPIVALSGYLTPGDGGGGIFYWIADNADTPVDAMVVQCTTGDDGRYFRVYGNSLVFEWFGIQGNGIADNTDNFIKAFDYIKSLGYGVEFYGSAQDYVCGPVLHDVQYMTWGGSGQFSPRITARDESQPYMFYFNNTAPRINTANVEFLGSPSETSDTFALAGVIYEDGTNTTRDCRVRRVKDGIWHRKGNYNAIYRVQPGLFYGYAFKFGSVNNAANALTSQSWSTGSATYGTTDVHGLIVGSRVTVTGSTPAGYNVTDAVVTAVPTSTSFTVAMANDPGASVIRGTVAGSGGAAISESNVEFCKGIVSGASSISLRTLTGATWAGGSITFQTDQPHMLAVGDQVRTTGCTPSGYNLTGTVASVPGASTLTVVASDPGLNTVLGSLRSDYQGYQFGFLTDCGAIQAELSDGGSTKKGARVFDDLGLGNDRAPGFVTLIDYTSGDNSHAGISIENNGSNAKLESCKVSAEGLDTGVGLLVDSSIAAVKIENLDAHRCARAGILGEDFYSIIMSDGTLEEIGVAGAGGGGIGVELNGGSGKLVMLGAAIDSSLLVSSNREMDFALRLQSGFTGTAKVMGCNASGMLVANWSNDSATAVLETHDNSDFVIVPDGARAEDVNQLIDSGFTNLVFPYPLSPGATKMVIPPEVTMISLVSGEPVITSTADIVFEVGGGGEERTTHGPTFQGEWWIDGVDRAELRTGFSVLQDTYKLCFDTLYLTNLGTGMTGRRGNIRGVYVDRLFMYNIRDYGVRFYSDTRLLEIDSLNFPYVLSNTQDSGAECVWFDFGPRVGSGGKNGANIGAGILYRGRNQFHTWGVINLTAQSWAATGGGQVTFTTDYKHGLTTGDIFFIGGSVPTGYNNTTGSIGTVLSAQSWSAGTVTFTLPGAPGFVAGDTFKVSGSVPDGYNGVYTALTVVGNVVTAALASDPGASTTLGRLQACYVCLAGTTGSTLIAKLVTDPGASTTLGYWAVSADAVPAGEVIYTAPRKMRLTNTSMRGPVDDSCNLEAGADFEFTSVTIDDPGTSDFNIQLTGQTWGCLTSALTAQSWLAGVVTFTTTDNHGLNPGDYFTTSGSTPAAYNGTWIALTASGMTLTAALAANPGASSVLGTVSGITGTLTAQSWAAGVLTYTTTAPHGLAPGDSFEIVGSTPTGYNGVFTATAGTTGSTLKAALVSDPGASSVLGLLRGKITFTTATVHGLSIGSYFVVQNSDPDGYNGTFQAVTVPSTTQVTAFRTFNPGPSATLGDLDVPLNINASGYHFGVRFHGSYRIRGGMLHECYGNGIRDEAIYAMPSTIDGLLCWNASWGLPGVNSGLYFANGCSNRTLISITSGTGDHWRHASRNITFAVGNVSNGDTLTLNGTVITFRNVVTLPFEVLIGATASETVDNLMAFINASNATNMLAVTPTKSTSGTSTVMTLVHYPGAVGNLYTLAKSGANITVGAPRLGGGTGTATQKYGIEGLADGLRGNRIINANLWNNITGQQSVTNLPLAPSAGGTGIANNDSSTVTISGAFPMTWVVAAAASITVPGSGGTLALLATANVFSARQAINVTDNSNPALRVTQQGTGDILRLDDTDTSDATPTVWDQNGVAIFGYPTAQTFAGGAVPKIQIISGGGVNDSSLGIQNWSSTITLTPTLRFAKARGGTVGSHTIVTNGTVLGEHVYSGSDGVAFIPSAGYRVEVDGTPGVNDMPGKHIWSTTLDGAAAVTDRWQLGNDGMLRALSGSFGRLPPVTKTADFTVAANENWLINNKAAASCTVTLPAAATYPGREIMIQNYQAFTVISASSNVVPLGGGAAGTAILSANAGRHCTLVSDGTNWIIMAGVI